MSKGRRLTGFSRLILVLIIIVPAAYVGSHMITGEELSWEKVKNIFQPNQQEVIHDFDDEDVTSIDDVILSDTDLEENVIKLQKKVRKLESELEGVSQQLESVLNELEERRSKGQ